MKPFFEKFKILALERNLFAKGICLLLSVVLWAYLSSSNIGELKFRIPIEMKNLPSYLTVSHIPKKYVIAILEGKKEYLKNVNLKNIKAVVNLKNPKIGESGKYSIELVKNEIPENINITFSKKDIKLTVERKFRKRVRVMPGITGSVAEGSITGKIKVVPEYIFITGPKSVVRNINYLYTENISVENESEEISREIELKREKLKDIVFSETNVRVTIPIFKYEGLNSFDIPVSIKNINENYSYTLDKPNIIVYIKSSEKRKITADDLDVSINAGLVNIKLLMKKENKIQRVFTVNVAFRNNIKDAEVISINPAKVMLTVTKK